MNSDSEPQGPTLHWAFPTCLLSGIKTQTSTDAIVQNEGSATKGTEFLVASKEGEIRSDQGESGTRGRP